MELEKQDSSNENGWWGYLHINGTVQVKRYFSIKDLEEAAESDFVYKLCGPFPAKDRDEAIVKTWRILGWQQGLS